MGEIDALRKQNKELRAALELERARADAAISALHTDIVLGIDDEDTEDAQPEWCECYECGWKYLRPENPVPWKFCPMCGTEWIGPALNANTN